MISVVIPLYNKENLVTHTIQSVLNQSFQDFEIVIVDDGSTDSSVEKATAFVDNRIRIIRQQNGGVSVARNKGIAEAKYEWIAFLDADDELKPTYLDTQWKLHLKYPECNVCACNYEMQDSNGKLTQTIINKLPFKENDGVLTNYFEVASCSNPPVWTSAVMVKKEAISAIGGFPVGVTSGEDLLTWARLAVKYKIAYSLRVEAQFISNLIQQRVEKPTRAYDKIDFVGDGFVKLYEESYTNRRDIKKYISRWYQMKTSVNLTANHRKEVFYNGFKSLNYNFLNIKIYLMLMLSLFPVVLRKKFINLFLRIK